MIPTAIIDQFTAARVAALPNPDDPIAVLAARLDALGDYLDAQAAQSSWVMPGAVTRGIAVVQEVPVELEDALNVLALELLDVPVKQVAPGEGVAEGVRTQHDVKARLAELGVEVEDVEITADGRVLLKPKAKREDGKGGGVEVAEGKRPP